MAYNLSSNQQYLLSMVQQNNPEILSKFLNEITNQEREEWEAAKQNPLGAVQLGKVRRGEIEGNDEQQAIIKASAAKEKERQASAAEHYQDVFAKLPLINKEVNPNWSPSEQMEYDALNKKFLLLTPQQAAEVAMYKIMTDDKKPGSAAAKEKAKRLKAAVETDASGVSKILPSLDDETLRKFSTFEEDETRVPSTQSKVALRYAKKAAENALPFEDRPISPFYKTTRKEFQAQFGRDFDASGGATPANMRGLINIKTDLPGRLKDIETGWQDKISWDAQLDAASKFKNPFAQMAASLVAKQKAEKENPVHDYIQSDFDVPPIKKPGEEEGAGRTRTIPTKPVDTKRTTEWVFSPEYDSPSINKSQASNLTGKSVNQKISRIA